MNLLCLGSERTSLAEFARGKFDFPALHIPYSGRARIRICLRLRTDNTALQRRPIFRERRASNHCGLIPICRIKADQRS